MKGTNSSYFEPNRKKLCVLIRGKPEQGTGIGLVYIYIYIYIYIFLYVCGVIISVRREVITCTSVAVGRDATSCSPLASKGWGLQ